MSAPTRRQLLAGAGVALAAGSAIASAHSAPAPSIALNHRDAELIAACGGFCDLERKYLELWNDTETAEDELRCNEAAARIKAEQAPLLRLMCTLQATTTDGLRARAEALALWDHEADTRAALPDNPHDDINDRMVAAMLRDLLPAGGAT